MSGILIELEKKPNMPKDDLGKCPECSEHALDEMKDKGREVPSLCLGYTIKYFYWECLMCETKFKLKKISKRKTNE